MSESIHKAGLRLLRHPVRPLLSIVEFILHTGGFAGVQEVLALLPENIETETAHYNNARQYLQPYIKELERFHSGNSDEDAARPVVFDADGDPMDHLAAQSALLTQKILEKELEQINSLLCGAHTCTLCCTGPDATMQQEYFDIPLREGEEVLFAELDWIPIGQENAARQQLETVVAARHDLGGCGAALAKHRQGTSLILPKLSQCPALDGKGRCSIYDNRPQVCRKPQIFPYLLEKEQGHRADGRPVFRLRNTLLAVMDCPYVQQLQHDIALYAAASELELVFRRNKA